MTAAAEPLLLAGPAGRIEAAFDAPDADVPARPLLAIVCHPLPTEGGSMHNKVVTMAARALRESGATTLRFNFRGVGQSEGRFDDGDGELDDLRAVAAKAAHHEHHARKKDGGEPVHQEAATTEASEVVK